MMRGVLGVIHALESLYELYNRRSEVNKDRKEEYEAFALSVREAQEKLHAAFVGVATSKGLTVAQFQELFKNPSNFTPQEWERSRGSRTKLWNILECFTQREKGQRLKKNG